MSWKLSVGVLTFFSAACAFSGSDPPKNECNSTADCPSGQVCNLVARRCEPDQPLPQDALQATFECTRFDLGATSPGTARLRAKFGGETIDLGVGCFARMTASALGLTIIGGDAADGRAVDVRLPSGVSAPATVTIGAGADAWLEKLDADMNTLPWAFAIAGTVQLTEVSDQRVTGEVELTLREAAGLGGACNGTDLFLACGSPGTGRICSLVDPSGTAVCRAMCFSPEMCPEPETCAEVAGIPLCLPDELVSPEDPPCTGPGNDECASGRTCVAGVPGDPEARFCRPICALDGPPACSGDGLCIELQNGGEPMGIGACLPNPCTGVTCQLGQWCKPLTAIETTCAASGVLTGDFQVTVVPSGGTTVGTGRVNGTVPGSGTLTGNGRTIAFVVEGEPPHLAIGFGTTDAGETPRTLWLLVPVHNAITNRALILPWEAYAEVDRNETSIATGFGGNVYFEAVGTNVGDAVRGDFVLHLEQRGMP